MIKAKDFPHHAGVYCIENTINGKVYIGSSKNLQKRIRKHLNTLRNNTHDNIHLQNAWNKDEEDAFSIRIICSVLNEVNLTSVEQYFLDLYQAYDRSKGYNKSCEAKITYLSEETKEKLRMANLGKRYSPETNAKKASHGIDNGFFGKSHTLETKMKIAKSRGSDTQPFICIETGETFTFFLEAAKKLNAREATISECLKGNLYVSNGFHFIYVKDMPFKSTNNLTDSQKSLLTSMVDPRRRMFKCLETGETFTSVNEAARKLGIDRGTISDQLTKGRIGRKLHFEYITSRMP
jgi:group I intron endonuclease